MSDNKIYIDLVNAQKQFAPALRDSTNPHFRSKYADLSSVVRAVIDALNDNGFFLSQLNHPCDGDAVCIETVLYHTSGEKITGGLLSVPVAKNDAQGYGSALTYARRYSLMTLCGVAPEDDDGNAASSGFRPSKAAQKTIKRDVSEQYHINLPDGTVYASYPTLAEFSKAYDDLISKIKNSPKLTENEISEKIEGLKRANYNKDENTNV
jgi:hypothetical protein